MQQKTHQNIETFDTDLVRASVRASDPVQQRLFSFETPALYHPTFCPTAASSGTPSHLHR